MKVFVSAYLRKNFGDDLFVYILAKRYPEVKFYALSTMNYGLNLENFKTICIKNKIQQAINFTIFKKEKRNNFANFLMSKFDFSILIGGSMFIENNNTYYPLHFGGGKDYFVMGCNFGPYETNYYYNKYKEFFKRAKDVSFRDSVSYNLFSDLSNVRYNPDIVFSLGSDLENNEIDNKIALISIIDCSNHKFSNVREDYENKILEIIYRLIDLGFNIVLFSFCKAEGDDLAIDRVIKRINPEKIKYVKKYQYDGNIEKSIMLIKKSSLVIGTRFHSIILALTFNKPVVPISYSIKTDNMLADLKFKNTIIDINNIKHFDVKSINEDSFNYICDVSSVKKKAVKHFEILDEYIKERNTNE